MMNPWGDIVRKAMTSSAKDPVTETHHAIQLFEKDRKESNIASYRRNDAYWVELKKMHAESLTDIAEFAEYLNNKKECSRKQGLALSNSIKPRLLGTKSKPSIGDDLVSQIPGAGKQTRKALEEFDYSLASKLTEEADFIEKDIIKVYTSQCAIIEAELRALWTRGDRLLLAVKLSDLRAKRNFDNYSNAVSVYVKKQGSHKTDIADSSAPKDLWLFEVAYSVAAARSYEIKDECNKQLRFLFVRAKEIEARRRAAIAKAGDSILTRQLQMWRNFPTLAGVVSERMVNIQVDPTDPLFNIGRTLNSRVEVGHDSVAIAMMTQQQERDRMIAQQRERDRLLFLQREGERQVNAAVANGSNNNSNNNSSNNILNGNGNANASGKGGRTLPPGNRVQGLGQDQGQGYDGSDAEGMGYVIPLGLEGSLRLPFPLSSPSLTESAVFLRQNTFSISSTTWTPVLLCLSTAGYLHMFDIDPLGESGTDASAFSNVAHSSKKGVELEIFSTVRDDAITSPASGAAAAGATDVSKPILRDSISLNLLLQTESFMEPLVSLSVPCCTVQFTPTANDTVFEIVEITPNTGMGSLFGYMNERRFVLRGASQAQMIDWILKIEGSRGSK